MMAAPPVVAVVGLQAGDEGKGSVVDALVRRHCSGAGPAGQQHQPLVVRFNGGPQSAHHVVAADGRVHAFSSLGSGTLAGAGTLIGRHVLVAPERLEREERALAAGFPELPSPLVAIDGRCQLVTPWHAALSKLRSLLGLLADADASSGQGAAGEAGEDGGALRAKGTSTTGVGVGSAVLELAARGSAAVLRAADVAACAGLAPDTMDGERLPAEPEPEPELGPAAAADSSRRVRRAHARVAAHVDWAAREARLLATEAVRLVRSTVGTADFERLSAAVVTMHSLCEQTLLSWPASVLVQRYTAFAHARGPASCAASPGRVRSLAQAASLLVLEGAQAILLDPVHGFAPHVTSTRVRDPIQTASSIIPRHIQNADLRVGDALL